MEQPHALHSANQNTDQLTDTIRQLMCQFLSNLKAIIGEAHNSRIDYYFVLSEMKKQDFFREVALLFNQDALEQNRALTTSNLKLKHTLAKTNEELRNATRSGAGAKAKSPTPTEKNSSVFNGVKTVAENLYEKAKVMGEEEFVAMCNKVLLGDKVVISRVSELDVYKKWGDDRASEREQAMKKIEEFMSKEHDEGSQETELEALISELKAMELTGGNRAGACRRPCCVVLDEEDHSDEMRHTKAAHLRRYSDARRSSGAYKNDRSEEYFNRYYRRSEFDMRRVTNVQATRMEEMERLEDSYRVRSKQRDKMVRSLRK